MAKTNSSIPESTTKTDKSQVVSAPGLLVKAEVYARLRNLTKFDMLVFLRMANASFPGARKTLSDWDSFKEAYQNSGNK